MAQIPFLLAIACLTKIITKDCPQKHSIMNYQLKNIWDPTNKFMTKNYENGTWVYQDKHNVTSLKGKKLRVAIVNEEPFVTYRYDNDTIEGISRIMLGVLREALGFDWQLVWPDDNYVGIKDPYSNERNGALKLVAEGKADFCISFMSMIQDRLEEVEFSRALGEERWVILMQRPQETTDGDGLVAPFQNEVWYYLLISLVLMGPICYVMIRTRSLLCKNDTTLNLYYSIGHCLWFVYGALMKQGSVLKPIADSTRVLFATWWIFVTILTAFYTANLTAYLTLSKVPIPFDSLDKVGYRDYWIARKGDTLEAVIHAKETKNNLSIGLNYSINTPRYKEFFRLRYKLGTGYGLFLTNETEMVEKVRKEKYLLLEEQSRVERIIHRDFKVLTNASVMLHKRCAFIMSRQPILRVPYGLAFPKNSPYKHLFDPVLDKLHKAGLFDYWRRKDLPMKDPCSADSDFRERQLRNGDLMTTYILCGSGYLLAFVSFVCECILRWIGGRKLQGQLAPAEKVQNNIGFYKGNLASGTPTFFDTDKFLKNINGRDYVVIKTPDGKTKLVPKQNDGMQALQPGYNPPPPISFSYMS